MNNEKQINKYLSSILMAEEIMEVFNKNALGTELKLVLKEITLVIKEHKVMMSDLMKRLGYEPKEDVTIKEKMVIKMEEFKTSNITDDFKLSIMALTGTNMGITKSFEWVNDNSDVESDVKQLIKNITDDYEHFYTKLKHVSERLLFPYLEQ